MAQDWLAWHDRYDLPGSSLHGRLHLVQGHLRRLLDGAPAGPIRVISICAGQGRDLVGAVADHPRRDDVQARLVELDPRNVELARRGATAAGGTGIEIVEGDASTTSAYEGAVPADIVLACGVFGNILDEDIRATVEELPRLCAAGASVIWTRYPRDPELLPQIDLWFRQAGFEPVALIVGRDGQHFGVGLHRLVAEPRPFRPDVRMFTFLDDPDPTSRRSGG